MRVDPRATDELLRQHHYLGPCKRAKVAWMDAHGCVILSSAASRRIPGTWLELSRWCLTDGQGSVQWAAFIRATREHLIAEGVTTLLSYSDPSVGHTGALYRACNWLWAPTWHRLRPPPSANGAWKDGTVQAVKDRWVFPLVPDASREKSLVVNDDGLRRRFPWASYREPTWRRGRYDPATGGGDHRQFAMLQKEST